MSGDRRLPGELTPEEAAELSAYLDGRTPPERRDELERKILASEHLADALYADVNLRATLEAYRAAPPAAPRGRVVPMWARVALPLAAGVALLVLSPRLFGPRRAAEDSGFDGTPRFRSGTLSPAPAVRGLAPTGNVNGEPVFAWTRDPAADGYRLELLGAAGQVVFSATTAETSLAVPRASLPDPAAVSAWRVVARRAGADGAVSAATPLRLSPR